MCIIVMRPANIAPPTEEMFQQCWTSNQDGAGVMWADGNVLYTIKGLMTFQDFLDATRVIPLEYPTAYHFRIGTNGAKDAANTHPWPIDEDSAMVHNGIISGLADDRSVSDSMRFARAIWGLPWYNEDDKDVRWLIENALGYSNKAVLMHKSGTFWIANACVGMWDGGCWFSNGGYKKYVAPTYSYDNPVSQYPARRYDHNPYAEASLIDQMVVKSIHYNSTRKLVHMKTKHGRKIVMAADDFAKHYAIYDYDTPALTQKADEIALSIVDTKQAVIDFPQ